MSDIRVFIIDDHPMVRRGLRMILQEQPGIAVVGEAESIQAAIPVLHAAHPTVITLDLSMPGLSGVASVQRLRALAPDARVIVVTMHDEGAYVRSALAMGASGFVHKSAADTELIAAIRAVADGRVFIEVGRADSLESVLSPGLNAVGAKAPLEGLSARERQVLRLVALGHTNQKIADDVGVSIKTVESYRARLMRKLGLKERADLVRLAMEAGLI